MVIEKVLNNNVVMVIEENHEKVIMGRGIAFGKKVGDELDEDKIEKVFILTKDEAKSNLFELMDEIPTDYLYLTEEIVSYIKTHISKHIDEMIYVALVDHIYRSIERIRQGIYLKNGLLHEIKRLYPDEYYCGEKAVKIIENFFKGGVEIPQDEAANIALHIVNAELDSDGIDKMYEMTMIMQDIINIVKYKFKIVFDENSVHYYRFITHLKFFAKRIVDHNTYNEDNDGELFNLVKNKYINSFACVQDICKFLCDKYNYCLSNEEMLYLTLHIERIVYKTK